MSFPCYPLETFETWEIEENLEPDAEDKHLVTLNKCFCFVYISFIEIPSIKTSRRPLMNNIDRKRGEGRGVGHCHQDLLIY